jgi:hypothetical protein
LNLDIKTTTWSLVIISLAILGIICNNNVDAAEVFTMRLKIDLTKLPDTEKLKVIAFANGEFDIKFIDNIQDMKSKSISVPLPFK